MIIIAEHVGQALSNDPELAQNLTVAILQNRLTV